MPHRQRSYPQRLRRTFSGIRYVLRFVPQRELQKHADESEELFGLCDSHEAEHPKLLIRRGLAPSKELEILIHEMLHAEFPVLSEEAVDRAGKELSGALWALGYRR